MWRGDLVKGSTLSLIGFLHSLPILTVLSDLGAGMKSTSVRCWSPPKLPIFSCFLHFARWFWNQIWTWIRNERQRTEPEMKEGLLTSNYFSCSLSEHGKKLTSGSSEPGAEPKGKHWVWQSIFHSLHSIWDAWAVSTASFPSQLMAEPQSPCSRKGSAPACSRSSRALLGKWILSQSKLSSSQGISFSLEGAICCMTELFHPVPK